ncbi:TB2_DP1_HVA22 domain-containing protein [Cephalotus follicularis]|uniref:HVA22-like protein n=1 Tax=Cephalotus follicularis TaxID=3775 RepID=A0A1Q3BN89_CEPFO|nr:TB2_DP1_HVA22 domain-containing protein [Cephalotus follicularis]
MLGDFITRSLVVLLGYAYPAFECYKTVEKNRVDIEELRFWCQYWILVAMLTVLERVGDIFVSWLPMYGELKLAFVIYLWYPKTKGTGYIYETLLRPYVSKHETDIDRMILEFRARAWDFVIYYWQNCTKLGQTSFFQILQYFAAQSSKVANASNEKGNDQNLNEHRNGAPSISFNLSSKDKRWPPTASPPSSSNTINRSISEQPKSDTIKVHPHRHTESVHIEDTSIDDIPCSPISDKLHQARMRLRRSKPTHN